MLIGETTDARHNINSPRECLDRCSEHAVRIAARDPDPGGAHVDAEPHAGAHR